jgi:hypothetical protein
MSTQSITRRIESLQRELNSLNRQLASETSKEASKTSRIAQIKRSITKNTSPSMLSSKWREIERLESDISNIQKKKADISKRISDKTVELHKRQQDLYAEQSKEQKKLQDTLRNVEREEKAREDRYLSSLRSLRSTSSQTTTAYHAFISHASEDKNEVVRPLAEALRKLGYLIWYDEFELKVGDSLRRKIDQGLIQSRFGIVILSPAFFEKNWPQYELDGLVAKEIVGGKVVLPIWHKISKDEVMQYSPSLADKVALNTAINTVEELASKLGEVLANT